MKKALKFAFVICISASLMMISACSKKSTPSLSVEDQQLALLDKSSWKVSAATKDYVDQMADYTNAVMTIAGTPGQTNFTYSWAGTSVSKKYPWKTSGAFVFDSSNPATTLSLDGAYTVTYAVTSTQLIISFTYTGAGNTGASRTSVVTGAWQYTFTH